MVIFCDICGAEITYGKRIKCTNCGKIAHINPKAGYAGHIFYNIFTDRNAKVGFNYSELIGFWWDIENKKFHAPCSVVANGKIVCKNCINTEDINKFHQRLREEVQKVMRSRSTTLDPYKFPNGLSDI